MLAGSAVEKWPTAPKTSASNALKVRQCGGLGKHRKTLHPRHAQGTAGLKVRGSRRRGLLQRDCRGQRGNDSWPGQRRLSCSVGTVLKLRGTNRRGWRAARAIRHNSNRGWGTMPANRSKPTHAAEASRARSALSWSAGATTIARGRAPQWRLAPRGAARRLNVGAASARSPHGPWHGGGRGAQRGAGVNALTTTASAPVVLATLAVDTRP